MSKVKTVLSGALNKVKEMPKKNVVKIVAGAAAVTLLGVVAEVIAKKGATDSADEEPSNASEETVTEESKTVVF